MTKFRLISDLHLEYYVNDFHKTKVHHAGRVPLTPPEMGLALIPVMDDEKEQTLILAGDILNARDLPHLVEFFNKLSERFYEVIYIMGNHEYYFHNYKKTLNYISNSLQHLKNVKVVNNQIIELDDCVVIAGTMWGNYNGNPLSIEYARNAMSDYKLISNGDKVLSPYDTIEEHNEYVDLLKTLNDSVKPIICVTHNAPSYMSVTEQFKGSPLNPAFVNNLDDLIESLNIKYWFHGHVHSSCDYQIGNTRVLANPRGYGTFDDIKSLENPNYNPFMVMEI